MINEAIFGYGAPKTGTGVAETGSLRSPGGLDTRAMREPGDRWPGPGIQGCRMDGQQGRSKVKQKTTKMFMIHSNSI